MNEKKVQTVVFRTANGIRYGDLVVIDGHPHLVWDWDGERPRTTTLLDPQYLERHPAHVPPGAHALYSQELADPRKLQ